MGFLEISGVDVEHLHHDRYSFAFAAPCRDYVNHGRLALTEILEVEQWLDRHVDRERHMRSMIDDRWLVIQLEDPAEAFSFKIRWL